MKKIRITLILLAVESVTLFYLYQLKSTDSVGALQYSQAVGAVGLTLLATLLLLASETIPSPKKKKKSKKK
jgi:hypothetical protein